MDRKKLITNFFAALLLAPVIIWIVEAYIVVPLVQWRYPDSTAQKTVSADLVQNISKEIASSLKIRTLPVFDIQANGYVAKARIQMEPYSIALGSELAKVADPTIVKAILAHEYGHLVAKEKNLAVPPVIYLLGNTALFFVVLFCALSFFSTRREVIVLVLASGFAGIFMASFTAIDVFASTSMTAIVAGLTVTSLKTRRRTLQFAAAMTIGLALYAMGIEIGTAAMRAEEIFADKVGRQVVGTAAMEQTLCALLEERNRAATGIPRLYVMFQEWQDVHPPVQNRARALDITLNCKNTL